MKPHPLLLLSPAGLLIYELYTTARRLFGEGTPPRRQEAPPPPGMAPATNNPHEQQAHTDNNADANRNGHNAGQANQEANAASAEVEEMRTKLDEIYSMLKGNVDRSTNGGAADTDNATTQAMRDGVRDMRNLVAGAADSSANRASGLPLPNLGALANPLGLGSAIPSPGMPGAGGGFNPFATATDPTAPQHNQCRTRLPTHPPHRHLMTPPPPTPTTPSPTLAPATHPQLANPTHPAILATPSSPTRQR